jgi:hypothetical protein
MSVCRMLAQVEKVIILNYREHSIIPRSFRVGFLRTATEIERNSPVSLAEEFCSPGFNHPARDFDRGLMTTKPSIVLVPALLRTSVVGSVYLKIVHSLERRAARE